MFFPYKDDNPRVLFPYITYTLITINVLIFLTFTYVSFLTANTNLFYTFGFIPNSFNLFSILSSMFIHGGLSHILSNMWFLYIFGDNIESILGHIKFLLFYILCGFGAAFSQYIIDPNSSIPMVGASGAIAGVLGAYMISFPKAKVHVFAFIIIFITTLIVPAQIVLGVWFFIQLSSGLNSLGIDTNGGVAWFAHIGGFIAGVGSIKYIQNYKI
ncbi:MAG: rhomboid family intramembrane serine protease [Candidatus Neomarinimicrobiota bacterium]